MRAALVQEVNRQAGVRWGQVSSGLFVVNIQQLGQNYVEKVPLVKLRRTN